MSRHIKDKQEFFRTRAALYMSLGIVPCFLEDKTILELGPGSGHNSIFTADLQPRKYVLVDGGEAILSAAKKRLRKAEIPESRMRYVQSLFEDYQPDECFDLVIAEACIPMQENPAAMLKKISSHVRPGGVLLITTISPVSYFSEILRRLGRDIQMNASTKPEEQLKLLRRLYQSHLDTLSGLGRSVDDWLLDNIVQPLDVQKLLSISDAIQALMDNFEFLGASPRLVTDWRWHKTMTDKSPHFNDTALNSYFSTNINLFDYRFETHYHSPETGKLLEIECSKVWDLMIAIENKEDTDWQAVWSALDCVSRVVSEIGPKTLPALDEAYKWIKTGAPIANLLEFPHWWGRGQQYLSFVRSK